MNAVTVYALLRKYIADTVDAHTGYIKGKNVIIKKTEVDDNTKDVKLTLAYTPDATTEVPSPKQVLTDINISAGFNAYETFRRNLYDIKSLDYANYTYEKWLKDLTDACDGQFIYLDQSKKHFVYDEATGDVKKDENGQPVMAYQFGDDIEENTVLHLDEDKKVTAGKIQTMYAQLLWNEPQDDVDEVNSVNWGWRQESGGKVLVSSAIGVGGDGGGTCKMPEGFVSNIEVGGIPADTSLSKWKVADVLSKMLKKAKAPTVTFAYSAGNDKIYDVDEMPDVGYEADLTVTIDINDTDAHFTSIGIYSDDHVIEWDDGDGDSGVDTYDNELFKTTDGSQMVIDPTTHKWTKTLNLEGIMNTKKYFVVAKSDNGTTVKASLVIYFGEKVYYAYQTEDYISEWYDEVIHGSEFKMPLIIGTYKTVYRYNSTLKSVVGITDGVADYSIGSDFIVETQTFGTKTYTVLTLKKPARFTEAGAKLTFSN